MPNWIDDLAATMVADGGAESVAEIRRRRAAQQLANMDSDIAGMEAQNTLSGIDLLNLQKANAAARMPGTVKTLPADLAALIADRQRGRDPRTGIGVTASQRGKVANVQGVARPIVGAPQPLAQAIVEPLNTGLATDLLEARRRYRQQGGKGAAAGYAPEESPESLAAMLAAAGREKARNKDAQQRVQAARNPLAFALSQGGGGGSGRASRLVDKFLGIEEDPRLAIAHMGQQNARDALLAQILEGRENRASSERIADKQYSAAGAGQAFSARQRAQEAWDAEFAAEKATAAPGTPDAALIRRVEARRGPRPSLEGEAPRAPASSPQDDKQAARAMLVASPTMTFEQFVMQNPNVDEATLAQVWQTGGRGDPYDYGTMEEAYQMGNPLSSKFTGFGGRDFWRNVAGLPTVGLGRWFFPSATKPKVRQ